MPSGKGTYGSKRGRPKSKTPKTIKGVSMSGLTTRQANAMKKHSKHHTSKHLKSMVGSIKKGKTFTESHKLAMKKVGK